MSKDLIPCPMCEAEYHIDGRRNGPAVISLADTQHRVMCLNCWHGGKKARTINKAIDNWNKQKKPSQLRKLREAAGLTQVELGELAGVYAKLICDIELGRVSPKSDERKRIAAALGVREDEI